VSLRGRDLVFWAKCHFFKQSIIDLFSPLHSQVGFLTATSQHIHWLRDNIFHYITVKRPTVETQMQKLPDKMNQSLLYVIRDTAIENLLMSVFGHGKMHITQTFQSRCVVCAPLQHM